MTIDDSARVTVTAGPPRRATSTRREPMWRRYHRWVGLVVALFFTIIAVSGVWLQFAPNRIDQVYAGRLGDDAIRQALVRALSVVHSSFPGKHVDSVVMNVSGAQPIATIGLRSPGAAASNRPGGDETLVIDLRNGQRLPPISQLHRTLVSLHNSMLLGTTGRVIDLVCASALLLLCLTGLYFYVVLWRRRPGPALFWRGPAGRIAVLVRDIHRWVTVVALVFLCLLAVTGALMQLGPTGIFGGSPMSMPGGGAGRAPPGPVPDVGDAGLLASLDHGLNEGRRIDPNGRLFMIFSSPSGPFAFTSLTYASDKEGMYSHTFDARTNVMLPPPPSNFFFLLRLHRGDLFGAAGTWANIMTGTALLLLVASGVWTYLDMYLRRRRAGRAEIFWRG